MSTARPAFALMRRTRGRPWRLVAIAATHDAASRMIGGPSADWWIHTLGVFAADAAERNVIMNAAAVRSATAKALAPSRVVIEARTPVGPFRLELIGSEVRSVMDGDKVKEQELILFAAALPNAFEGQ